MSRETVISSTGNLNHPLQGLNAELDSAVARDVVRCDRCLLVQFRTTSGFCRRCAGSLAPRPRMVMESNSSPAAAGAIAAQPVNLSIHPELGSQDHGVRDRITRELALGNRVRQVRESRNLTQEEVASRAGVPRTYISRIENAHLLPGTNMVHRLAQALGVEILDLIPTSSGDYGPERRPSAKIGDMLWRTFAPFVRDLRDEQVSAIIWHARAMLCERLRQQNRIEHPKLGHARLSNALSA